MTEHNVCGILSAGDLSSPLQVSMIRACTDSSASTPEYKNYWASLWVNTETHQMYFLFCNIITNSFLSSYFCPSDPKTCADVELENSEWEIKTITSAIKHYLRFVWKGLQKSTLKKNSCSDCCSYYQNVPPVVFQYSEINLKTWVNGLIALFTTITEIAALFLALFMQDVNKCALLLSVSASCVKQISGLDSAY